MIIKIFFQTLSVVKSTGLKLKLKFPRTTQIEWTYSKDDFARSGQDAGWVDMVSYEPGLKPKIEINPNLTFYLGDEIEIPLLITGSHDVMGFEELPDG